MYLNKSVIGILLLVSLLLLSCQPQEKAAETDATTEVSIDGCAPHWECTEAYKVQVLENCTRVNPTKCERGCVDGECRPAGTCTTGFKCIDDFRRGYQKEDCSFIAEKKCEWGCWEGECQEKPANIFENASEVPASESEPKYSAIAENQEDQEVEEEKTIYTLKVGEQQQISINGVQTNVSIHFLEPGQVTIKVNGIKSNPLPELGNATYENIGATFYIEWILFQAYAGGKQEIGYSVK